MSGYDSDTRILQTHISITYRGSSIMTHHSITGEPVYYAIYAVEADGVYGIGATKAEAYAQAAQNLDGETIESMKAQTAEYGVRSDRYYRIAEISQSLYDAYQRGGYDARYHDCERGVLELGDECAYEASPLCETERAAASHRATHDYERLMLRAEESELREQLRKIEARREVMRSTEQVADEEGATEWAGIYEGIHYAAITHGNHVRHELPEAERGSRLPSTPENILYTGQRRGHIGAGVTVAMVYRALQQMHDEAQKERQRAMASAAPNPA